MNRREMLLGGLVAGALPIMTPQSWVRAGLHSLFNDVDALSAIGPHILALLGQPDQATLLAMAGLPDVQQTPAEALLQSFADKRQADFRSGRIHIVNGWVMAEAECALCAVLAAS